MGRGGSELVKECFEIIKTATGVTPDTSRWMKAIDEMFDRGLTPGDIVMALKLGLKDQWHRARVMDYGLVHVNKNCHTLLVMNPLVSAKPLVAFRELYKQGKHQRWDMENHVFMEDYRRKHGVYPGTKELHEYADRWYSQNLAIANEWVECPVCKETIDIAVEVGVDPFRRVVIAESLVKSIDQVR